MARVPDEAIRRRKELTAGAWHLYELYCLHRNSASGQCNPSNTTLAAEMRCSYTHVSDCKSELIEEGWIARAGRQQVRLLVGEFAPLKVRQFEPRTSENSELQLRNIPNFAPPNFGEFRTSTSGNSELGYTPPAPPIRIEPVIEPVAAAAAATEITDFRKQPIDEAFLKAIVAAKLYPPDLVEFVKNKLTFRCAQEGTEPTKGRLLYWLSTEREAVQTSLFEPRVLGSANFRVSNPNLLTPKEDCSICQGQGLSDRACECQICPHCNGTGFEISDIPSHDPEQSSDPLWIQMLRVIGQKIQNESFETWFVPIRLISVDREQRCLHLWAPNQVLRDWVKSNYSGLLDDAFGELEIAEFCIEWSTPSSSQCRHIQQLRHDKAVSQ